MSHNAQVEGSGPYLDDLNSTLLRAFLESVGPTKKQNQDQRVGSCVCAIAVLNWTILSEELGCFKWYQSLISCRMCANKDVGPQGRWEVDCSILHCPNERLRSIYG